MIHQNGEIVEAPEPPPLKFKTRYVHQKAVIPVAGDNPMQVVDNGDGTVTVHPHPALKHLTLPRVIFTDSCGKVFPPVV